MDSDFIITGKERRIMRKRWKAMAVCTAFLLSLPTGCGVAEDLNETDMETAGNAVTQESMAAVEETTEEWTSEEETGKEESTEEATTKEETSREETAEEADTGAEGETAGESLTAGAYTYHLETEEMAWNTSDGEAALTVTLEYPVFEGNTEAEEAINTFYRGWAADKLESYEAGTDSLAEGALEFRESEVSAGAAPWADDYSVAVVTAVQGVISIRQDNYLFTGGAHGMPGRENHIFSETDGSEVTLASLLPLSEEEVNGLAREAFLSRIEEHPEDGYFEDAADTIRAKTDFFSQSYLTQEGVVFYAQPYEIGPYASGFIEVTVPWEDLGL